MLFSYTKQQWTLLVIFCIAFISCNLGISLQGPFFPPEAEKKGIKASRYGFIFGVFYLVYFFVSSFCGKLLLIVDSTAVVKFGLFTESIANILFGFLEKINNTTIFLALSYVFRILEAIGYALFLTASHSIFAIEFFDDIGTIGAILQTSLGVGFVIGPALGGILFDMQGFLLPFVSMGALILCTSLLTILLLKSSERYVSVVTSYSFNDIIFLLRTPEIILSLCSVGVGCLTLGFCRATIEPHLRSISLNSRDISLVFSLTGLSYSISALVWGRLCDKWISPQIVWSVGATVLCTVAILSGPAPYFQIPLTTFLGCLSMALLGIGSAAEIVSAFYCMNKVAIKIGFPNDISTFGIVSASYNAAFALGEAIGPTTGGFLTDKIGFPWGVHFLLLLNALFLFATLLYCLISRENVFPNPQIRDLEHNECANDKLPLVGHNINHSTEMQISKLNQ